MSDGVPDAQVERVEDDLDLFDLGVGHVVEVFSHFWHSALEYWRRKHPLANDCSPMAPEAENAPGSHR
jgi:hypothetical protein